MKTILKISIFMFILSTVGCVNSTNPMKNHTPDEKQIFENDLISNAATSSPQILFSTKKYNKIKQFDWSDESVYTRYKNTCKSIAIGKYVWRHSPNSKKTYYRRKSKWNSLSGIPGGAVLDMSAIKINNVEYCFAISSQDNKIYASVDKSNFEFANSDIMFKRIDSYFDGNKIWITGVLSDGTIGRGRFYRGTLKDFTRNTKQSNIIDIAFMTSKDEVIVVSTQNELYSGDVSSSLTPFHIPISNCRRVEYDRAGVVWVVKHTGSVYWYVGGGQFFKKANKLAWDVTAQ